MTDALSEQNVTGNAVTMAMLKAELYKFEQHIAIKGAVGLVLLGGFLACLKQLG